MKSAVRDVATRVLVVLTVVLGVDYVVWHWIAAVNWSAWWIAVPLALAETGSLVGACLFGVALWRAGEHEGPVGPDPRATVDVFVTAGPESVELVLATARAARRITFPHRTWILDARARPELRAAAESAAIGYLACAGAGRAGHVTADDLETALFVTDGEFLLVLDAGQIPAPSLLDEVLGYFRDPDVAVVHTPQSDPDATVLVPLVRGEVFRAANVVLRREALMQLGIAGHSPRTERTVRRVLRTAETVLRKAREEARQHGPGVLAALDQVEATVEDARREVRGAGRHTSIAEITHRFRQRVDAASRGLVDADVVALHADLAEREPYDGWHAPPVAPRLDNALLAWLARQDMSPLRAMASVRALVDAVDITHDATTADRPTATQPVTEDVTTTVRLNAMGWTSACHPEPLTHTLPAADLDAVLRRLRRWARAALPVLLTEPWRGRGPSAGQRLGYLAAVWSAPSAFFALVYLAAPALLLAFDVHAVVSYGPDLLLRLVPYLLVNQVLLVVGHGRRAWRGTAYGMALHPVWIRATLAAAADVVFRRPVGDGPEPVPTFWRLTGPQLATMALLVGCAAVGCVRCVVGPPSDLAALVVNLAWVLVDLVILSVVGTAALRCGLRTARPATAR